MSRLEGLLARLARASAHETGPPVFTRSERADGETSGDGMRTHRLGDGGPEVSVLGLGCNTFGLRIGLAETREIIATALDLGDQLLRHRRSVREDGQRTLPRRGARRSTRRGRNRHQVGVEDARRRARAAVARAAQARDAARLRALHPLGARPVAATSRHRLDRRLPVPQARRRDAAGGDVRDARVARARREDPLGRASTARGRRTGGGSRYRAP